MKEKVTLKLYAQRECVLAITEKEKYGACMKWGKIQLQTNGILDKRE